MAWPRRKLVRLDMLCLGANPEKLGQREIPAIEAPPLSDEQQQRLYTLKYRNKAAGRTPLALGEQLELQRLVRLAKGAR